MEDFRKINERRRYFRIPSGSSLKDHLEDSIELFFGFKSLVSELIADAEIEFDEDFEKVIKEDLEFASFILKKVTNAVEEWKEMKKDES